MQGLRGLFNGSVPSASQSAIEKFIYFYSYETIIKLYQGGEGGDLGTVANLVIGYVAEFGHLPITMPLDQSLTRFQSQSSGPDTRSYLQCMRDIYNDKGLAGFYKGMDAQLVLCLKPAIQFTVFDQLKNFYLRRLEKQGFKISALTALQAFILGALARAVATFCVFPYTRCKMILYSGGGKAADVEKAGEGEKRPMTIPGVMMDVLKKQGVLGLYQGLMAELGRGVLSAALMLMVKEKLSVIVKAAVLSTFEKKA